MASADQRRHQIPDLLARDGYESIEALARVMQVSEMTIRRDLNVLENEGLLADRTKFNKSGSMFFLHPSQIDCLITEGKTHAEIIRLKSGEVGGMSFVVGYRGARDVWGACRARAAATVRGLRLKS